MTSRASRKALTEWDLNFWQRMLDGARDHASNPSFTAERRQLWRDKVTEYEKLVSEVRSELETGQSRTMS